MDIIKDKINYIYHHLFNAPIHPFFQDIRGVNKLASEFIEHQKKTIKIVKQESLKKKSIEQFVSNFSQH